MMTKTVQERITDLLNTKLESLKKIPPEHIAYAIMEEEIDDCRYVLKNFADRHKLLHITRHTTSGSLWRLIDEELNKRDTEEFDLYCSQCSQGYNGTERTCSCEGDE